MKIFKTLTNIRKTDAFQYGDYMAYANDQIFVYKRSFNAETYIVLLNFSNVTHDAIDLTAIFPNLSKSLEVITTSLQSDYVYGYDIIILFNIIITKYLFLILIFKF